MIPSPVYPNRKAYVYLLRSLTTKKSYLGWTTDIHRRLEEHNSGVSKYTKSRGPWELIGYETHVNAQLAKERERKLKHNPRMHYFFRKRVLTAFIKNSAKCQNRQNERMIPSPVYLPKADTSALRAEDR